MRNNSRLITGTITLKIAVYYRQQHEKHRIALYNVFTKSLISSLHNNFNKILRGHSHNMVYLYTYNIIISCNRVSTPEKDNNFDRYFVILYNGIEIIILLRFVTVSILNATPSYGVREYVMTLRTDGPGEPCRDDGTPGQRYWYLRLT